ncbi:AraC family transcriptional regulator [Nocardia bovistercoris]|uniref:Helix-turn-helix transcriptional regulator n=1 Tax=Nocardia bovistercoris TaxID=2785916 RepID=A0A931IGA2_9NOCA|nr:helix-turn-helix transcriptional regulator [Nocardia bovistercoris]MBH0779230.1 helix-turn-helix transcriptional regulator [Nocardia bovistercoris]
MTDSTLSATHDAESAKVEYLRRSAAVTAGSYVYEEGHLVTGWHRHDLHQIQYAAGGVVEVETATAHYLSPPHRAVWIPAGLAHQTVMSANVRAISVMFDPSLVHADGDRAAVLDVSAVIREMIIHAQRWPIYRLGTEPMADRYFTTLGELVLDAIETDETYLNLPVSDHPVVGAAMAYTKQHLVEVTIAEVARAVAVSERTLRRLFDDHVGYSWRTYLLNVRMLRAMALLASPRQTVQETARAVGFDNAGSFSRAFTEFSGQSPSSYRRSAESHL